MDIKSTPGAHVKALNEQGQGTAVIATLNVVDKDGDVTMPGAFGQQDVKMVPAHDWSHVPIGKAKVREEGDNVLADFKLNLDIPAARDWYASLKADLDNPPPLQEWSYGFTTVDSEMGQHQGQDVRFLRQVKVHEISPVMLGAGMGTGTLAIKHAPDKPMKLVDHIAAAIETVQAVADRCKAIREARAADGRDLSPDRFAQLATLDERIEQLHLTVKALHMAVQDANAESADPHDADMLFANFIQLNYDIAERLNR